MQDDKSPVSGAPKHHPRKQKESGEVLAPAELERSNWGREFKRYIKAAAALSGLYEDAQIADAVGRTRNTVQGWWRGARPEPDTANELADQLGLDRDEVYRWLYQSGPAPTLRAQSEPPSEDEQAEAREWARGQDPTGAPRPASRRER